eukprot:6662860-Prymnesium_polylepis.1
MGHVAVEPRRRQARRERRKLVEVQVGLVVAEADVSDGHAIEGVDHALPPVEPRKDRRRYEVARERCKERARV